MIRRFLRISVSLAMALALLFCLAFGAAALDDKYRFDEFGMSVKVPKSYYVITRESSRDDEVFKIFKLDYDETMTAFKAADIYLRAYDPEGVFQISMTVSSDDRSKAVNNYYDLSESERKDIAEALSAEKGITSAVEIKHGGNIFFDTSRTTTINKKTLYINQCNTIINGLQIDLSLQKSGEEILNGEATALTDIASSMEFDEIKLKNNGPVFEWWRLLLWVVILAAISGISTFFYKRYNAKKKRKLEERRLRRIQAHKNDDDGYMNDIERPQTFEEALGYQNDEQFTSRAPADDLDAYDIKVESKSPSSGVSFFEDEGESIDDRTDYFDTYFKEKTESRSGIQRLLSTVGAYIGIAFRHIGYFFKNIINKINGKGKQ